MFRWCVKLLKVTLIINITAFKARALKPLQSFVWSCDKITMSLTENVLTNY